MPRACALLLLAGIAFRALSRRPRAAAHPPRNAVPPLPRDATAWGLPISTTVH